METQNKGHLQCHMTRSEHGISISLDGFHCEANLSADTFQDAWDYMEVICKLLRAAEDNVSHAATAEE